MPRVSSIQDVFDANPDEVIYVLRAKIKNYFKVTPVANGTFQDLVLTDDSGEELKCVLKDIDPLDKNLKGKWVYFVASHGAKGWSGVYARDSKAMEKDGGGMIRKLWITATGEIIPANVYESNVQGDTGGGNGADDHQEPAPRQQQRQQGQQGQQQNRQQSQQRQQGGYRSNAPQETRQQTSGRQQDAPPPKPAPAPKQEETPAQKLARAGQIMDKTANLICKSLERAEIVRQWYETKYKGKVATPEMVQAWSMSVFMSARERGCIDLMPAGERKTEEPPKTETSKEPAKEQPQQPAQ